MPSVRRLWVAAVIVLLGLSACGLNMSGEPDVVSQQEIGAPPTRLPTQAVTPPPAASTAEAAAPGDQVTTADFNAGMQIYLEQCASCHGAQEGVGPSLAAMKDVAATRVEGQSAEEYLRESILNPSAYIVPGYEDLMPKTFGEQLGANDIDSLVKFIMEFSPEAMMAAANATQPTPGPGAATPTLPPIGVTGETLTVEGSLIQGTADGKPIPTGVELNLIALDAHGAVVSEFTATSAENGSFDLQRCAARHRQYVFCAGGLRRRAAGHPGSRDQRR